MVSFGRCKFRLFEDSVSYLLHATIGGSASQFRVSQLAARVFKFSISCQQVGIFICRLVPSSVLCSSFIFTFGLVVALTGIVSFLLLITKKLSHGLVLAGPRSVLCRDPMFRRRFRLLTWLKNQSLLVPIKSPSELEIGILSANLFLIELPSLGFLFLIVWMQGRLICKIIQ